MPWEILIQKTSNIETQYCYILLLGYKWSLLPVCGKIICSSDLGMDQVSGNNCSCTEWIPRYLNLISPLWCMLWSQVLQNGYTYEMSLFAALRVFEIRLCVHFSIFFYKIAWKKTPWTFPHDFHSHGEGVNLLKRHQPYIFANMFQNPHNSEVL